LRLLATLVLALGIPAIGWAQATATAPTTPAAAVPATAGEEGATPSVPPVTALQDASPFVSPLRPEGSTQWSAFYGFGINQEINKSAKGIHVATGGVRWSHMWGENFGSILRGHPTVALEFLPVMAFVETGRTTWGVGANLLYEHHFAVQGRVLPVWKLGVGVLYTDREIPVGETKHNFSVLTALGVDFMVTDRSALFLGYRLHHVSNANTGNINRGINVHSLMFGLSFYR